MTCDEPPALVAHSLGGASPPASRPSTAISSSGSSIYGAPGVGRYRMPLGLRVMAIRFALRPTERNAERFERLAFFDLDRVRARGRGVVRRVRRRHAGAGARPARQADDAPADRDRHQAGPGLERVAVPATLLWGRHDRFVPLALGEAASRRLGWPLHVVDGAGHVPHVEQSDAFLEALA